MDGFAFGTFRLDLRDERLWQGDKALRVNPKAFAVLRCLVQHGGQLVSKDDLLNMVWPDTVVSEGVLTVAVRELRQALGDRARSPVFIETVHGRGYRFIARVEPLSAPSESAPSMIGQRSALWHDPSATPQVSFVGRQSALAQMSTWLTAVRQGHRQLGLISGEAGIGKSALVEAFISKVVDPEGCWIGYGQCIESYGSGEAYLPLLEALGRLGRHSRGAQLVSVLQQYAPSWLEHLPGLTSAHDRPVAQRSTSSTTQTRMLRELAEALEILTAKRPLVLILEDLHWSDHATLEWLSYVARRRDPARLLILGTYRPQEVSRSGNPLRSLLTDVRSHRRGLELVLDYLSEAEIEAYLNTRSGPRQPLREMAHTLYARTNGNPLFLVSVVAELEQQGILETDNEGLDVAEAVASLLPANVEQLITHAVEQLPVASQSLLEAASVVGRRFEVASVSATTAQNDDEIEKQCASWTRAGRFVEADGMADWLDGTVTACYRFRHDLYQDVLYRRVSAGRLVRLHRQIGLRKEVGYGRRARTIAAELSVHFLRGHDNERALTYLHQAGRNAIQRHAHQEAIAHFKQGLTVLAALPETPERLQRELDFQVGLGPALFATKGHGAAEVERAYLRARELCHLRGNTPQLFSVLRGLMMHHLMQGELQTMHQLGEQLLDQALSQTQSEPRILAYFQLGIALFFQGVLPSARDHFTQALAIYDPQAHQSLALRYGIDPGVASHSYLACTLWQLGCLDQALQHSQEALALAEAGSHPYSMAGAHFFAAVLHQFRRDALAVRAQAEAGMMLAVEQGFALWLAWHTVLHGWARSKLGQSQVGIDEIHRGLVAERETGSRLMQSYLLALLAEVHMEDASFAAGLNALTEAIGSTTSNIYEAEQHRLKGELLWNADCGMRNAELTPEAFFQKALGIARRQQCKSWELRAAVSLARLWQLQGKRQNAYGLLAPVYEGFTEGFDMADLREARMLLNALS